MLKSILGLVIPESGKIFVNGEDTKDQFVYRNNIGYMPQIANYPENLKVKELFNIVKDIRSRYNNLDEELIESFYNLKDRNEWNPHPMFGKFTKQQWGQMQYKHLDHHLRQFGV